MDNDAFDDLFGNPREGRCPRCGGNGFFEQGGNWVSCGCEDRDGVAVVSYQGVRHAVCGVGGSPEDGSLYGFLTICGRSVGDPSEWIELPGTSPNCSDCCKIVTFPDQMNPEADGSDTTYAIEARYGLQQGDDWLIAHQLLIDTATKWDGEVWMQGLGMVNGRVDAAFSMEAVGLLEDNGDDEYGGLKITAKGIAFVKNSPTYKRQFAEWQTIRARHAAENAEHAELVAEYREAGLVDENGRYIGLGIRSTPPDRDLAPGEAPCVICMDDAVMLFRGYSLCDRHHLSMASGLTYDQLLTIQDQQTEFDIIHERQAARDQHAEDVRAKIDSFLRSQTDEDLALWERYAATTWRGEESHKCIQDEIERRKSAATKPDDPDDLAHDLGVIIFAGIYVDGDDAESMRSEAGGEAYNAIRMGVDTMRGKMFELESILRDLLSHPRAWTRSGECNFCLHALGDHEPDCPIARTQKLLMPIVLPSKFDLGHPQRGLLTELLDGKEHSTHNYHWTREVMPLMEAHYITVRTFNTHVHLATITDLGRQAIAAQPDVITRMKETK